MYFRCCCSITNARFLSLHINYIKSIWITRTNLRLDRVNDRANSQTMSSYPVRFSADIIFLLSSIVAFAFVFLFVWFFFFFLKLKIYILTHIRLCVWMSYQKNSPADFSKQDYFSFWTYLDPKVWELVPENLKRINSLTNFEKQIKKWNPENCPCRLCKTYIQHVGFINWHGILLSTFLSDGSKIFCILHIHSS